MRLRSLMSITAVSAVCFAAGGCYEESGDYTPQQAQSAPAPQPSPMRDVGQPASSALGKAKQSATNIADRAEQKSREVANQADEMMDPK